MGEKEQGSGAGLFKSFRGAGKKGEGDRGRGARPGRFPTERKERGVGWEKRELTGGPGLSVGEEREGKGEGRLGRSPGRIWGARGGLLGYQAEKRKGERGKGFSFFFYTQFPNEFLFFKYFLEQDILVFF